MVDLSDENRKIRALQAVARERAAEEGSPWQRLATGELSDEERAALEQDTSDEARLKMELYRPFTEEEQERVLAGVRARLQNEARPVVIPIRRRRAAAIGAAVLAAAAAVLPLALRAPVPEVAVAWTGKLGPGDAAVQQLEEPDAPLAAAIVPLHPIKGTLRVRGALAVRDGRAIAWDPHPNPTTTDNQIYLPGTRRELFPCMREGEWTLLLAVGVEGPPLTEAEVQRAAGQPAQGGYQVLSKRVWLGAPVGANGEVCGAVR
jgi:hypothetical protein